MEILYNGIMMQITTDAYNFDMEDVKETRIALTTDFLVKPVVYKIPQLQSLHHYQWLQCDQVMFALFLLTLDLVSKQ
jgi:hypothetical protein